VSGHGVGATPGPWRVKEFGSSVVLGNDPSDDLVCNTRIFSTRGVANAALIVRAVNSHTALVEALQAALPHLIEHHMDPGAYKAARMVEEAIALARLPANQEGRSSERGECNLAGRVPQPSQASPSAPATPALAGARS
jgi:hypothetical protein